MGANMISSFDLIAILPEIFLLVLIAIIMVVDIFRKKQANGTTLGWITFSGLLIIILIKLFFLSPGNTTQNAWGGMIRVDAASFTFQLIVMVGAAITTLFSMNHQEVHDKGEYFAMLLLSVIGMSMMAAASNIILLYLAIETTAIPLYVLVGFLTKNNLSIESGLKFFLFGAFTSAVLLYGFSLLLTIVGFGAKISGFPFHFWAPDAYQGAPTPIAGYLSTASKAIGFVVIMRFMVSIFAPEPEAWSLLLALIATASMFVGNLLALVQKDIKRLFAYSSIAHAGYMLIGVASGTQLGFQAAMYYLLAYLFTNLAIFGVIHIVEKSKKSNEISAFQGLMKRSPGIALVFLIAVLSLAGIPPFGGFISKILVFLAAMEAGLIWLLIIGILNSIIALYYYLTVLRITFAESEEEPSQPVYLSWKIALSVCVIGILVLGVIFTPWLNWLNMASTNLMLLH